MGALRDRQRLLVGSAGRLVVAAAQQGVGAQDRGLRCARVVGMLGHHAFQVARGAVVPAVGEIQVALAPHQVGGLRMVGEALEQHVGRRDHRARQRVARRRAGRLGGAGALVPGIGDRHPLPQRLGGNAVAAGGGRGAVVAQCAGIIAEVGAGLAGRHLQRRKLGVVRPAGEHRLVELERGAPVRLRSALAGAQMVFARLRHPRSARERGRRRTHRVRGLGFVPRAAGREARGEEAARGAHAVRPLGAALGLDQALGAHQRVRLARVALDAQLVDRHRFGEAGEPAVFLSHRHQDPHLVWAGTPRPRRRPGSRPGA